MRFGVQLNTTAGIDELVDLAQLAERAGFDAVFLTDGMSLQGRKRLDVFTAAAVLARETRNIGLGTSVANIDLRHPLITAQAAASVAEISGGRFMLGLGTGDTPLAAMGLTPMRIGAAEAALALMRRFIRGEELEVGGRGLTSTWARDDTPVLLAADGPRALAAAGRTADGVIVGSGLVPDVVRWATGHVEAARVASGRAGLPFATWINGFCQLAASRDEGRAILADRVLPRIHHNFRFAPNAVPPPHLGEVERFRAGYDGADRSPETLRRNLGLVTDYLFDRFAIAGPADQVVGRFRELAAAGVTNFIVATQRRDRDARRTLIRELGEQVIPHVVAEDEAG